MPSFFYIYIFYRIEIWYIDDFLYTEEDLDCFNPIEQSCVENIENTDELLYQGKGESCYFLYIMFLAVRYLTGLSIID